MIERPYIYGFLDDLPSYRRIAIRFVNSCSQSYMKFGDREHVEGCESKGQDATRSHEFELEEERLLEFGSRNHGGHFYEYS